MKLFASKATKNDPDTFTWEQAMASSYKEQFIQAAYDEINTLVEKNMWVEDLRINATTKIIPGTWVFRNKRTPDGEFKKAKA